MGYYDLIDTIVEKGKLRIVEPDVSLSLGQLQHLANCFADRVVFVQRCNVLLTNIETSTCECVKELFRNYDFEAISGNLPHAMICMEVGGNNDSTVFDTPEIHIFHERFLTVGVLLHELAHLYRPFDWHGKKFCVAKNRLEMLYWRWFSHS